MEVKSRLWSAPPLIGYVKRLMPRLAKMHLLRSVVLLLAVFTGGCVSWTQRGDVLVSDGKPHWGFLAAQPTYHVKFPSVRVNTVGSTTIRVRDLPVPILPEYADLEVPEAEDRVWEQGQPWRVAVLQFTFRAVDGVTLYTKKVALSDGARGSEPAESRSKRNIYFRVSPWDRHGWSDLPPPPDLRSYDLVIDVITPSPPGRDLLTIRAWERAPREKASKNAPSTAGSARPRADAPGAPPPAGAEF